MCLPLCISGDINALRNILLYHFSNGIVIGDGLESGVTNLLKSIQGTNLKVKSVGIKTTDHRKLIFMLFLMLYNKLKHVFEFSCLDYLCCHNKQIKISLQFMPNLMICNCFNCLLQAKDSVQVNSVKLTGSDIMATNGVIHFIDQLLFSDGKNFFP